MNLIVAIVYLGISLLYKSAGKVGWAIVMGVVAGMNLHQFIISTWELK